MKTHETLIIDSSIIISDRVYVDIENSIAPLLTEYSWSLTKIVSPIDDHEYLGIIIISLENPIPIPKIRDHISPNLLSSMKFI